eukprot:1191910-Prymnesium_polylepis.2
MVRALVPAQVEYEQAERQARKLGVLAKLWSVPQVPARVWPRKSFVNFTAAPTTWRDAGPRCGAPSLEGGIPPLAPRIFSLSNDGGGSCTAPRSKPVDTTCCDVRIELLGLFE